MIHNRKNTSLAIQKWMALLSCLLFANLSLQAQEDSSNTALSDTSINATQKTIFQESAKYVEKDTLTGIIMIICVIAVVILALYLSFKSPKNGEKRKKVIERQQKRGHSSH
jgi:beta-lactamase regulating signal transducer with metallopeptidase domain